MNSFTIGLKENMVQMVTDLLCAVLRAECHRWRQPAQVQSDVTVFEKVWIQQTSATSTTRGVDRSSSLATLYLSFLLVEETEQDFSFINHSHVHLAPSGLIASAATLWWNAVTEEKLYTLSIKREIDTCVLCFSELFIWADLCCFIACRCFWTFSVSSSAYLWDKLSFRWWSWRYDSRWRCRTVQHKKYTSLAKLS